MRLIFTLTLLFLSFSSLSEQQCGASNYTYQQCDFVVPELSSGTSKTITMINSETEGAVGVTCQSGLLSFESGICRAAENGCLIPANQWISKAGNSCKHAIMPGALANGQERTILSTSNDGLVKYQCKDGALNASSLICNDFKNNQIQSLKVLQQNSFEDVGVASITNESCDVAVIDFVIGEYNVYEISDTTCAVAGYENLIEIISADPSGYFPSDEISVYGAMLRCSGNVNPDTMCALGSGETDSEIVTVVQNCDDARISGIVLDVNVNQPDDVTVQRDLCNASGYQDLLQIVSFDQLYRTAGDTFYKVTANCSGNTNPATRCDTGGSASVISEQCGDAEVVGYIENIYRSTEPEPPVSERIQSVLCTANGFDSLESVLDFDFDPMGINGNWTITAICGNSNAQVCNDPCLGNPWMPDSTRPPIATPDGVFEDMCSVISAPAELCNDCENASIIFTDDTQGNTCRVSGISLLTGEADSIIFNESGFSGVIEASCNSGLVSVVSGECYQSCQGGNLAQWADGRGDLSCQSTIPSGEYTHGQQVDLTTTSNNGDASFTCNNGDWEQVGPSQCLLDCTGDALWGNGLSRSGVNKSNLCSANVGLFRHGSSGVSFPSQTSTTTGSADLSCDDGSITVDSQSCFVDCRSETGVWGSGRCASGLNPRDHTQSQTVSTPPALTGYSGTALFSCDDGFNVLGTNTCRPDCAAGNVSVGACTVPMPAAKALAVESYAVSTTFREGAGSLRCNGGSWTPNSGDCVAGVVVQDPWSAWNDTSQPYSCGQWSPDTDTVASGEQFTQYRSCSVNQVRTASRYREFNPFPRRDFINTVSESQVRSDNQSQTATGTLVEDSCLYSGSNMFAEQRSYDDQDSRDTYYAEVIINGSTVFEEDWATEDGGSYVSLPNSIVINGVTYTRGSLRVDESESGGAGGSTGYSESTKEYEVCSTDGDSPSSSVWTDTGGYTDYTSRKSSSEIVTLGDACSPDGATGYFNERAYTDDEISNCAQDDSCRGDIAAYDYSIARCE